MRETNHRLSRREFSKMLTAIAAVGSTGMFSGCRRQHHVRVEHTHRILAEGLRFPEGPVAMTDGSVLVVEIERGTLTRIDTDGTTDVIAEPGGGPNGAAIGPDGACYVCNNGGDNFREVNGVLFPVEQSGDYNGGRIERVELDSGRVDVLYHEVNGHRLSGPNDLVIDNSGGLWFTDIGKTRARNRDHGGIYYARTDGSLIREVVYPVTTPNGIGLSPDGKILYVAELLTARLIAYNITGEGELDRGSGFLPGQYIGAASSYSLFDSLAIEEAGNICVAGPLDNMISCFKPDGGLLTTVTVPASLPTNICFGGTKFKTAYITLGGSGKLIAIDWPRKGLPLNYSA